MSDETDTNEVVQLNVSKKWITYFIQPENGGLIKIGRTKDLKNRLSMLQTGSAARLVCLGFVPGDRESEMHQRFARLRIFGEWFRPAQDLIQFIITEVNGAVTPVECEASATFEIQWLVRHWQREYRGEWIDGLDKDSWEGRLNELDGFVHEREFGPYTKKQKASVLKANGRSDPIFNPHDEDCECDTCNFFRTCWSVSEIPCYGAIWDSDSLTLTIFVKWPDFPIAQQEIMDTLIDAYGEIEGAGLPTLRAFRVYPSGDYKEIDLWRSWIRGIQRVHEKQMR